jgi:hypothetical protein
MPMNQLVLTLTNMTTMRFDQLGVRVDGFKERMKALEEQGLDTNAAFKEAFLQQAEQQLTTVGEAADSTSGSYMRLEAAIKNASDALKMTAAVSLEPAIKSSLDWKEALDANLEAYTRMTGEVILSRAQYNMHRDEIKGAVRAYEEWKGSIDDASASFDAFLRIAPKKIKVPIGKDLDNFKKSVSDLADLMNTDLSDATSNYQSKLADLNEQLEQTRKPADRAAIIAQIDAETAAYEAQSKMIGYNILQKQLDAQVSAGVISGQTAVDFLNTYAQASGLVDENQSKMLSTAENLISLMKNGTLTADQATSSFLTQIGVIAGFPAATAPADAAVGDLADTVDTLRKNAGEAAENADGLKGKITALDGVTATATINIIVNGSVPNIRQNPSYNPNQPGHGFGSLASGGMLGKEWSIVGDAPGGAWTPYTEIITPTGYVLDSRTSKRLKDAGVLGDAQAFMTGGTYDPGYYTPPTRHVSGHSGGDIVRGGRRISRRDAGAGGPGTVTTTGGGGESTVPVSALTATVSQEVDRMGGAMKNASVANVVAVRQQTNQQVMSNQTMTETMNGIRGDLRRYNETIKDGIREAIQGVI